MGDEEVRKGWFNKEERERERKNKMHLVTKLFVLRD